MEQIRVDLASDAYSVHIGHGLIEPSSLSFILDRVGRRTGETCAIITNPVVGSIYAEQVLRGLRAFGLEPQVVEIPEGEQFKTLDTVRSVYDRLLDAQLDRRSTIFALGGGVVGDVAGFVAATFLRGVPFVQMPTTLLAMVDASIGGKVAVDHPRGKNLIGAFKQPLAVIVNLQTLTTLPDEEWRSGSAEVVKHALIGDPGLLEVLESPTWKSELPTWIVRALKVKIDIVVRDPFEQGERAKLNLGHTFGHALEQLSDFKMRHGDAVAIGLMCASRLSARLRECSSGMPSRVGAVLQHLGLPTQIPLEFSAERIVQAMQTDKKRIGKQLRFVIPRALGDVVIRDQVDRQDVLAILEEMLYC